MRCADSVRNSTATDCRAFLKQNRNIEPHPSRDKIFVISDTAQFLILSAILLGDFNPCVYSILCTFLSVDKKAMCYFTDISDLSCSLL